MPYYLETDDRDLLKKLRQTNVCKECGNSLEAFYDIERHLPYLQCKDNPEHEGIEREASRYQKEGLASLNIPTRREIMEQEYGPEKTKALARLPMSGALTQPQAEHILSLVYPNVPKDEVIRCAILCRDFGLHPLMKEVYIIGFKNSKTGKTDYSTVIGITANRKMAANRKGAYSFIDDTPRAATQEEIIRQFGKGSTEERDNLISICKLKGEKGNEATGFGLWPKNKEPYGTDKGNTQRNMANIRSERQALDRLPGEALPPIEVIDEAYAELPEVGKVDIETGEVIEGEVTEVKDVPKEHWCEEHNCAYELMAGRYGPFYAHKLPDGKLCKPKKNSEPKTSPVTTDMPHAAVEQAFTPPDEPQQPESEPIEEAQGKLDFDPDWLKDSLKQVHWQDATVKSYLKNVYQVDTEGTVVEVVARLTREQREAFVKEIQDRLEMV